jgi:hypothetical protein
MRQWGLQIRTFRYLITTATALAAHPQVLCAQLEVGVQGGVHIDRADRPDRYVAAADGGRLDAAPGEAAAWGGRAAYWVRPRLGIQADFTHSRNESWSGSSGAPPPEFSNTTSYFSVRGVVRTNPERGLQLFGAAGPALIRHGGAGFSYLAGDVDVGGLVEVGARVRLTGGLGLQLALSNYLYPSRYAASEATGATGTTEFRHDILILPGLTWSWQ